jgi:hypothetical protein
LQEFYEDVVVNWAEGGEQMPRWQCCWGFNRVEQIKKSLEMVAAVKKPRQKPN